MVIGYQPSKEGLNQTLGQIANSADALFESVNALITWAAQNNDSFLTTAVPNGLGYTVQEAADFRTYVADITNWRDTTFGQRAQTPASNFLFNILKARAYVS